MLNLFKLPTLANILHPHHTELAPVTHVTEDSTFLDHINLDSISLFEDPGLKKVSEQIVSMTKSIKDRLSETNDSNAQLETVMDKMTDALVCSLVDGTIISYNAAAFKLFKYSYDEIVGKPVTTLLPERFHEEHKEFIKSFVASNVGQTKEIIVLDKFGQEIDADISLTLYNRAGTTYLYAFLKNISERKAYERELRKQSKLLAAVSYSGRKLLVSYTQNINKVLERLGTAVDCSRVYLFLRSRKGDGQLKFRKEWVAEGYDPILDDIQNMPGFNLAELAPDWLASFEAMQPVIGLTKDILNPKVKVLAENKKTLSFLLMPIFVSGKWRGFIGFDECRYERIWTPDEIEALRGAAGSIAAAVERYTRDQELKTALAFEKSLMDAIPNPVFVKSRSGTYIKINRAFLEVFGVEEKDVIGKASSQVFTKEFAAFYSAMDELTYRNKACQTYRGGVLKSNPTTTILNGTFFKTPLFEDSIPEPIGLIGTFIDMTEQYRYEDALAMRNALLQAIFSASTLLLKNEWKDNILETLKMFCDVVKAQGSAVFKKDNTTHPTIHRLYTWNRKFDDLKLPDSLMSMPYTDFLSDIEPLIVKQGIYVGNTSDINTTFSLAVKKVYNIESLCYLPIIVNDSVWGYLVYGFSEPIREGVETILSSLKLVSELFSLAIERDLNISTLRESNVLYKRLFDTFPEGYIIHNKDQILACNKSICNLTRLSLEQLQTAGLSGIIDSLSQVDFWNWINSHQYNTTKSLEIQVQDKDGGKHPVEVSSFDFDFEGKKVNQTFLRDISAHKIEKVVKTALYKALDASSDLIILTDSGGTIVYANSRFLKYYQYSISEVLGKTPRILNSGTHSKEFFKDLWDTLLSGKSWEGALTNKKKDGTLSTDDTYITPITNGTTRPIYFLAMKRTAPKEL